MIAFCDKCGRRHHTLMTCRAIAVAPVVSYRAPDEIPAPVVVANKTVANRHGAYADIDKRRAYMREYMRARRAKRESA